MMLRSLWLLFAQGVTLALAALFVVATLRPDLLPERWHAATHTQDVVVLNKTPVALENFTPSHLSLAPAVKNAIPAVVNLSIRHEAEGAEGGDSLFSDRYFSLFSDRYFSPYQNHKSLRKMTSLGSGVIVSSQGHILTNYHVVRKTDDIRVSLADGRIFSAKIRGVDPETDLAVLQVDAQPPLPVITFADMNSVQVGDIVLAIGNPFGFGNSVSMGIVSALDRNMSGAGQHENFIQTDASINPGNSGGALIDTSGNLIGINSTSYSPSGNSLGIGFAIPVSLAQNVMTQIIETGEVSRGWLGIEPQTLEPETAKQLSLPDAQNGGVLIIGLQKGGPADRAGMQFHDIIAEINGKPVRNAYQLLSRIAELAPGDTAQLRIWRASQWRDIKIEVDRHPLRSS
ncbi:MAG: trypsin-like peptidase domain-containing protein [Burkholderiales bacterium]|jgi:serine protease DegQ|nr:trypsin-like peptidase domain-containing protein [Burkholderiales bacterium]